MGKVLNFKTKFELELSQSLKAQGYSEEEINEALNFVKGNPLEDDNDPNEPPQKKAPLAEVIELPVRLKPVYLKAA